MHMCAHEECALCVRERGAFFEVAIGTVARVVGLSRLVAVRFQITSLLNACGPENGVHQQFPGSCWRWAAAEIDGGFL